MHIVDGGNRKQIENARKNRLELIRSGVTRREMARLGLLTASGFLIPKQGLNSKSSGGFEASPPTRPFVVPLQIPPVAQEKVLTPTPAENPIAGEAPRPAHQRWAEFKPQKSYELVQSAFTHRYHPDLPANTVWGYNGTAPGPTIMARYGVPITVRHRNNLPAANGGFGLNSTSTHLHNGHTPSESDGFPLEYVDAGLFKDHRYPNVLAGYDQYRGTNGDPNEALGTLWYHDHRMDFTAQNTYKGLSGFYLLFDERDSGNETDTNPVAFRLPSGPYDIPLQFVDRCFDSNGQLYFDLFNTDGILGDKFLVNGVIQPFLRVAQRKYRFRLLNSGPARFYEFSLSNGMAFTQISNDGNLLEAPVQRQSIRLSVAERADVVLDFTNIPSGTEIILLNRLEQEDGRGPTDKILSVRESMQIMKFIVDGKLPKTDPSRIPATLRRLPPVNTGARVRTFKFERTNGQWVVNGELFDPDSPKVTIPKGSEEIWVFQNNSGGWQHPAHIHFEEFQVLSRNGNPPPPWERSRKDVVRLGFNEEIRVFMRFRDFAGRYVMHCHNTLHEDDAMMMRWDIAG